MRAGQFLLPVFLVVLAVGCGRIGYVSTASDAGLDGAVDAATDAFAFDVPADVQGDAGGDVGSDVGVDAFVLVDECLVDNGGCDVNARCTDEIVGRTCRCADHFVGDGLSCMVIPPSALALEAFVKSSSLGVSDYFGRAIAVSADGNTLAVGANYEDGGSTLVNGLYNDDQGVSGAVYVYRRTGGVWTFEAYIKASNTGASDEFGVALALSDDGSTLAVGARDEDGTGSGVGAVDDDGGTDCGAAYVYQRTGTTWDFEAYIKASNTGNDDEFGNSLALSGDGDVLAIGARLEDSSSSLIDSVSNEDATDSGAVYVYRRTLVWAFEAYIKAGQTSPFDEFGSALALNQNGSVLAIGAHLEDSDGMGVGTVPNDLATGSGGVYIYRHGAAWSLDEFIKATNTGREDEFGVSVALSSDGTVLAVGAQHEDGGGDGVGPAFDEGAPESGAAYIYRFAGGSWRAEAFIKAPNSDLNDEFGLVLTLSRDGSTLAVGAPFEDGGSLGVDGLFNEDAFDAGAVYIYRSLASNWGFDAYVKASNSGTGDQFGASVALSADGRFLAVSSVNEDSDTAVINGTPNEDSSDSGAVYLYR